MRKIEDIKSIKMLGWIEISRLQDLGLGGKRIYIPKRTWKQNSQTDIKKHFEIEKSKGKNSKIIFSEMSEFFQLSKSYIRSIVYKRSFNGVPTWEIEKK